MQRTSQCRKAGCAKGARGPSNVRRDPCTERCAVETVHGTCDALYRPLHTHSELRQICKVIKEMPMVLCAGHQKYVREPDVLGEPLHTSRCTEGRATVAPAGHVINVGLVTEKPVEGKRIKTFLNTAPCPAGRAARADNGITTVVYSSFGALASNR